MNMNVLLNNPGRAQGYINLYTNADGVMPVVSNSNVLLRNRGRRQGALGPLDYKPAITTTVPEVKPRVKEAVAEVADNSTKESRSVIRAVFNNNVILAKPTKDMVARSINQSLMSKINAANKGGGAGRCRGCAR